MRQQNLSGSRIHCMASKKHITVQRTFTRLALILWVALFWTGCTRDSVTITEDMPVSGSFDPAFAVPLVYGTWTFGDALASMNISGSFETESSGAITAVFPFDAFESQPVGLVPFSEGGDESLTLDAVQAAALSALPEGEWMEFTLETQVAWEVPELASVDSIWLGSGELSIAIGSTIPANFSISGTCDGMRIANQGVAVDLELFGAGSTSQLVETSGSTLLGEEAAGLTLEWQWSVWVESTGEPVAPGASIDFDIQFIDVAVEAAFGLFPPDLSHPVEARVAMPEWASWDPALFYLSEPRLVLDMGNSFGVDMALAVEELALVTGSESLPMTGTAVSAFPALARAEAIGDTTWTQHMLDNEGVDPELSSILNLAPDSLSLMGTIGILPPDVGNQFATATDVLQCAGRLEIPLAGWAEGVRWSDTIAAPISADLQAGLAPNLDWTDVQSITLRFIVSNGWPLELSGHAHFINAAGDSLVAGPDLIIPGGVPIAPATDPIVEVVEPMEAIVDFVLERDLALELLGMECAGVVLHVDVATTAAASGQEVRVRSQNALSLRLAAMVQTQIDPNP